MKLSKRLLSIAGLVPKNSIVGDIGTDHGYIPAYLIENKISKKVIGTDISKGSLDKIIGYIKDSGFEMEIESRLGYGLEVIKPYEIDTVVIAGMGGVLINEILGKDKNITNSITNFILQPMLGVKELRIYLMENNFEIIKEELIKEENKYYEIIFAKKGKGYIEKDIHYEIAEELILEKHPMVKEFVENKIYMAEKILKDLEGNESEKVQERYSELSNLIREYKDVLIKIEG